MKQTIHQTKIQQERVLIVAVHTKEWHDQLFDTLLLEMEELTKTAGGLVVATMIQNLPSVDRKTLIGKGKLEEVKAFVEGHDIDTVITLNDLKPIVNRNLEETLDVKVIDRIQLILDIFALRAQSSAGKLQVELAQYEYLLPRIIGKGKSLSRLGAGIGTRGPGETKLESDRRHIRERIHRIKEDLKELQSHRQRTRQRRNASTQYQLGLIGYTNAGKSTLLTQLTGDETYVQDQLFATLDPLTRHFDIHGYDNFTITDTVGFIEDLPTELIHAFESTLEEIKDVDMLIHVVDGSSSSQNIHETTVMNLVNDLDLNGIPMLTVYNKQDLITQQFEASLIPNIQISAYNKEDIHQLKERIWQMCLDISEPYTVMLSPEESYRIHEYQSNTLVTSVEFDDEKNIYRIIGYKKQREE